MTFDLAMMKSLEVLLAESVNLSRLEARYVLPKQLVKLEVRRSIKNLQVRMLIMDKIWNFGLTKKKNSWAKENFGQRNVCHNRLQ